MSSPNYTFFFFLMIRRPPRSTPFPTRRSSDLCGRSTGTRYGQRRAGDRSIGTHYGRRRPRDRSLGTRLTSLRSEEHTSELQSQSNLVCRLLLEKKTEPILPNDGATFARGTLLH